MTTAAAVHAPRRVHRAPHDSRTPVDDRSRPLPVIEDATRRQFLALLAASGLLTACAPDTSEPGAGTGYPRTITTPDDGPVVLDRAPRRIAALNGGRVIPFLLPFLSAEHQLVGFGGDATPEEFPWIAEQLTGLPHSPDVDGPNVEAYASWRPDILIANGNVGDYWEPTRAVGPLVQLPETDWRATTRLLGELFTDPGAAERTVADTEAVLDAARRDTPITAAVVSPYQDDGTVGLQVLGAELPNFLTDLGVQVAPSATALDGYEDVSLELVAARLDVDHVIIFHNTDELQDGLLADPLFAAVPAVAQGRYTRLTRRQSAAGFPVTPPTIPILLDAFAPVLAT